MLCRPLQRSIRSVYPLLLIIFRIPCVWECKEDILNVSTGQMKQQRPPSLPVVCIFFIQDQAFSVGKQFEHDKPACPSETQCVSVAVTVQGFDMVSFVVVHVRFLKAGADVLAAPLTHIFNLSLHTAIIPRSWKSATVTPVHKDGSVSDPNKFSNCCNLCSQ